MGSTLIVRSELEPVDLERMTMVRSDLEALIRGNHGPAAAQEVVQVVLQTLRKQGQLEDLPRAAQAKPRSGTKRTGTGQWMSRFHPS